MHMQRAGEMNQPGAPQEASGGSDDDSAERGR